MSDIDGIIKGTSKNLRIRFRQCLSGLENHSRSLDSRFLEMPSLNQCQIAEQKSAKLPNENLPNCRMIL